MNACLQVSRKHFSLTKYQMTFRYLRPFQWPGPIANILQKLMSFSWNKDTGWRSRLLNNNGPVCLVKCFILKTKTLPPNIQKCTSFTRELLVFLYLEYYVCFIYWKFTFWKGNHFCLLNNSVFGILLFLRFLCRNKICPFLVNLQFLNEEKPV